MPKTPHSSWKWSSSSREHWSGLGIGDENLTAARPVDQLHRRPFLAAVILRPRSGRKDPTGPLAQEGTAETGGATAPNGVAEGCSDRNLVARLLVVESFERHAVHGAAYGGGAGPDDFEVAHGSAGAREDDAHLVARKA